MKTYLRHVLISILIAAILSACGPNQAEQQATVTQMAANVFGTQTAQAPTPTATYPPTPPPPAPPTPPPTNTPTSTPTNTPTPTLTPTPGLVSLALKASDLPAGFTSMDEGILRGLEESFDEGASAFGFIDPEFGQVVIAVLYANESSRNDQPSFDSEMPAFIQSFAEGVVGNSLIISRPKNITGLEDVGNARAAVTTVSSVSNARMRWDTMVFRRGVVAALVAINYPDGNPPSMSLGDAARLLDGRMSAYQNLDALRTVTIVFNVTVPENTAGTNRKVYLAGNLDQLDGNHSVWNPGDLLMTRVDDTHWTITLTGLETTQLAYKYTLGNWEHVEKGASCGEIHNRRLTVDYKADGTLVVEDTVLNWRNVQPCGN